MEEPGVAFYRSSFDLTVPEGLDLSLNVVYPDEMGPFRSQCWINGWMVAKRVGDLGPQLEVSRTRSWAGSLWSSLTGTCIQFPVPPGILVNGTNVIAVSYWSLGSTQRAEVNNGFDGIKVVASRPIKTGYNMQPVWQQYVWAAHLTNVKKKAKKKIHVRM
jgi:hypothetical protein